jgi:hypothetical protein
LPGGASLAYWLGLAFQLPSWSTVLLATLWLLRLAKSSAQVLQGHESAPVSGAARGRQCSNSAGFRLNFSVVLIGAALGALLLADTIAWLPWTQSLYAWGFSPLAVALCGLGLSLAWVASTPGTDARTVVALVLLALGLHVATRLPTGNVWDALIDPWLWALCCVALLRGLAHRMGGRRSG